MLPLSLLGLELVAQDALSVQLGLEVFFALEAVFVLAGAWGGGGDGFVGGF